MSLKVFFLNNNVLLPDFTSFMCENPLSHAVLVAGIVRIRSNRLSAWAYSFPNLLCTCFQFKFSKSFEKTSNAAVLSKGHSAFAHHHNFPDNIQTDLLWFWSFNHQIHLILLLSQATTWQLMWTEWYHEKYLQIVSLIYHTISQWEPSNQSHGAQYSQSFGIYY